MTDSYIHYFSSHDPSGTIYFNSHVFVLWGGVAGDPCSNHRGRYQHILLHNYKEFLIPDNRAQIDYIKDSSLNVYLFTRDYYYHYF